MAITAQEIHNKRFDIDRKGYDVDQVDEFLEQVADDIDVLNNEIVRLQMQLDEARAAANAAGASKQSDSGIPAPAVPVVGAGASDGDYDEIIAEKDAQIEELAKQLAEKQANDSAISQALIIAQRSADEILSKANAQASETMQDAREEADRILSRANADKQDVIDAIHRLEDDREDAREHYADILRDFIEDANRKLNDLGYDDDIDNIPGIGRDASRVDVIYENEVSPDFIPAEASEAVGSTTMPPVSRVIEKDLSGYGDVEDSFEDVD